MSTEQKPTRIGVIGGGISGLGVAYHLLTTAKRIGRCIHVEVYDKNSAAGGTWSKDSVYEGLMTNNSWTQMLFDGDSTGEQIFKSDSSMGAGPGGFRATGKGMIKVMEQVERQALEQGAMVFLNTEVTKIDRLEKGGWLVTSRCPPKGTQLTNLEYDKLVIATGAFSRPAIPHFAAPFISPSGVALSAEQQSGPLAIHTSHLSEPTVQQALQSSGRRIIVVGASKSALDASERFSTLGQNVTHVLRNPPYLAPPALSTAAGPADAVAMVGTRQKAIGVPYPSDVVSGQTSSGGLWATWFRWMVHSSWLSAWTHAKIIMKSAAGFARWGQWTHPLLSPMIPKIGLMWSESSIFPGPESFAQRVQQERIKLVQGAVIDMQAASVDGEDGYSVTIRNNETELQLFATAVIFGTGWSTGEYPFFDANQLESLGLPVPYERDLPKREQAFASLDQLSLSTILSRLRTMRLVPAAWSVPGFSARLGTRKVLSYAPYRLYRLMVPLDSLYDRDIVFAGVPTCKANHVMFICQAHWISDYLLDRLPRFPSREVAQKEISMQTVWAQRLFGPSHGRLGQWLGAMWIEYCSRLCWDMGVADDGQGWKGVVTSKTYNLEAKRAARDSKLRTS